MKEYKCIDIIGPYNGPYCSNIITAILESETIRIAWHSGPNKTYNFKLNEVYINIKVKKSGIINYKNSNPTNIQLKLL